MLPIVPPAHASFMARPDGDRAAGGPCLSPLERRPSSVAVRPPGHSRGLRRVVSFLRLVSQRIRRRRTAADYPWADINLSIRLGELTKTTVSQEPMAIQSRSSCPAVGSDAVPVSVRHDDRGRLDFAINDEEATNLRTYLLKGGFLWVDDFWGTYCVEPVGGQIRKVFPPSVPDCRFLASTFSSRWPRRRRSRTSASG